MGVECIARHLSPTAEADISLKKTIWKRGAFQRTQWLGSYRAVTSLRKAMGRSTSCKGSIVVPVPRIVTFAIVEDPSKHTLVDVDAFYFIHMHFDGVALDEGRAHKYRDGL